MQDKELAELTEPSIMSDEEWAREWDFAKAEKGKV